jgi:DNA-binding response OmpR family regulator
MGKVLIGLGVAECGLKRMEKGKIKILIIDDEADFCYFIKQNLEATGGFNVDTCSDSTQGLEIARQLRPDLILLDIMMPIKDGFTVLRELKADELTWAIPVIMLTAKGDSQSVFEGKQYHAMDYIIKPFEIKELSRYIKKSLFREEWEDEKEN